jgi:hypothetical protein
VPVEKPRWGVCVNLYKVILKVPHRFLDDNQGVEVI